MSFIQAIKKKFSNKGQVSNNSTMSTEGNEDIKPMQVKKVKLTKRQESEKSIMRIKVNLHSIYNQKEDHKAITKSHSDSQISSSSSSSCFINTKERIILQFHKLLNEDAIVDLMKLKQLSWQGIPPKYRAIAWKIMLNYLPINKDNRDKTLLRKREEYTNLIKLYILNINELDRDETENKIHKIISADVPRTQPDYPLFRLQCIQNMMLRILYIWALRHPASGYVQGINDLITPFIAVFLIEYIDIDYNTFKLTPEQIQKLTPEIISNIESDTYWCLCKILDNILDNYTSTQPNVYKIINKIQDITEKVDPELNLHLKNEDIQFTHFAFRWVYCLLLREFPLMHGIRLFDTYIAEEEGFNVLHTYICSAMILKWSTKLKKLAFNEIMVFLQNLPTKNWTHEDVDMLLAEAYVFRMLYENSPRHFINSKSIL